MDGVEQLVQGVYIRLHKVRVGERDRGGQRFQSPNLGCQRLLQREALFKLMHGFANPAKDGGVFARWQCRVAHLLRLAE